MVDFWGGDLEEIFIVKILRRHFDVVLDFDNPTHCLFSVFGTDHLRYLDCVRIFYNGENYRNNFNLCDYAISFDYLSFGDRHLRYPLAYADITKDIESQLQNRNFSTTDLASKPRFCGFMVSNPLTKGSLREEFFKELCKYKKVDSAGKILNNIGGQIMGGKVAKLEFLSQCKFNICFENSIYDGYFTEKLIDAFRARTIPIYLGDPTITEVINKDAFINIRDFSTTAKAIKYIKYLDSDEEAYLKMQNAPIFLDDQTIKRANDDLENFLLEIFSANTTSAKRMCNSIYEKKEIRNAQTLRKIAKGKNLWRTVRLGIKNPIRRLLDKTK